MDHFTNQEKIKAFVPKLKSGANKILEQLLGVLHYANIEVYSDEKNLPEANLAILVIGSKLSFANANDSISEEEYWFQKFCKINEQNSTFRTFIWQPVQTGKNTNSSKQSAFINNVRNNLIQNMIFCNHLSAVMFIEDIRSIVFEEQKTLFDTKPAEVFFIHNEIDEDNSNNIVELLNDVVKVKQLSISLRSETDYSEFIAQQINKTQLTTIYFNRTANWAVPFAQQVWKKIGGASANKQILMIGDATFDANNNIAFNAPNVTNICTGTELIPLETKVFFDTLSINK